VLIINRGRIVAQGAPRELIAQGSAPSVFVTVRGDGCLEALAAAPFAASVAPAPAAGTSEGFVRLAVRGREGHEGEGGGDVSVEVYRLAVARGWTLAELRPEAARLEEVFANLTRAPRDAFQDSGRSAA